MFITFGMGGSLFPSLSPIFVLGEDTKNFPQMKSLESFLNFPLSFSIGLGFYFIHASTETEAEYGSHLSIMLQCSAPLAEPLLDILISSYLNPSLSEIKEHL
jgi:hypothetical protein